VRLEEDISCGSWVLRPEDAGLHREVHSMMVGRDSDECSDQARLEGIWRDEG
jgi:hypothetical protein